MIMFVMMDGEDGDDNGNDDDDGGDDDCVEIGCGWRGADLKSYQP